VVGEDALRPENPKDSFQKNCKAGNIYGCQLLNRNKKIKERREPKPREEMRVMLAEERLEIVLF